MGRGKTAMKKKQKIVWLNWLWLLKNYFVNPTCHTQDSQTTLALSQTSGPHSSACPSSTWRRIVVLLDSHSRTPPVWPRLSSSRTRHANWKGSCTCHTLLPSVGRLICLGGFHVLAWPTIAWVVFFIFPFLFLQKSIIDKRLSIYLHMVRLNRVPRPSCKALYKESQ